MTSPFHCSFDLFYLSFGLCTLCLNIWSLIFNVCLFFYWSFDLFTGRLKIWNLMIFTARLVFVLMVWFYSTCLMIRNLLITSNLVYFTSRLDYLLFVWKYEIYIYCSFGVILVFKFYWSFGFCCSFENTKYSIISTLAYKPFNRNSGIEPQWYVIFDDISLMQICFSVSPDTSW